MSAASSRLNTRHPAVPLLERLGFTAFLDELLPPATSQDIVREVLLGFYQPGQGTVVFINSAVDPRRFRVIFMLKIHGLNVTAPDDYYALYDRLNAVSGLRLDRPGLESTTRIGPRQTPVACNFTFRQPDDRPLTLPEWTAAVGHIRDELYRLPGREATFSSLDVSGAYPPDKSVGQREDARFFAQSSVVAAFRRLREAGVVTNDTYLLLNNDTCEPLLWTPAR